MGAREHLIGLFQAADSQGLKPSARSVIAFGRALGLHFQNGEGYAWLRPFAEAAALRDAPRSLPERAIEEGGAAGSGEPLPGAPSRRAAIELVSKYVVVDRAGELAEISRGNADRELACTAWYAVVDLGLAEAGMTAKVFTNANQEAAQLLAHKHGRDRVLAEWTPILESIKVGSLKRDDVSLRFLHRLWPEIERRARKAAENLSAAPRTARTPDVPLQNAMSRKAAATRAAAQQIREQRA